MTTTFRASAGETFAGQSDLKVMCCPTCGIIYAIPERLRARAKELGGRQRVWFCPNGHELGYSGRSEAQTERERAEKAAAQVRWAEQRLRAERELREDTERRLSAQKGQTTKARKRAAAALCPCCNRSFVQLRRHMETKHPDYDPERA